MKRNIVTLNSSSFIEEEEDLEIFVKKRLIAQFSSLSLNDSPRNHVSTRVLQNVPESHKKTYDQTKKQTRRASLSSSPYVKNKKSLEVRTPYSYGIHDILRVDCFMKRFIDQSLEMMQINTMASMELLRLPEKRITITNLAIEADPNTLAIEEEPRDNKSHTY